MNSPELSIIIVNYNTREFLKKCLQSVTINKPTAATEIFVVDNNSNDGSDSMVKREFPGVKLIANRENAGFARANNQAIAQARGSYIMFLNPDTETMPGAIDIMLDYIRQRPAVGMVAPLLLYGDGTRQRSCRDFPGLMQELSKAVGLTRKFPNHTWFGHIRRNGWDHDSIAEVDQPMGACLLISRVALEKAGYFDERFYMYYDDVDLCYRISRQGYKIFFLPEARIIHHLGKSFTQNMPRMLYHIYRSKFLFYKKHSPLMEQVALYIITILEMSYRICVYGVMALIRPGMRTEIGFRLKGYAIIFYRFITGRLTA